jgi:hypothetical protein
MTRRRHHQGPEPITDTAEQASLSFPENVCLICGRGAKRFTSQDVPELMKFLQGQISERQLAAAARLAFPQVTSCLVAPLAGVSVCATKQVAP